MPFVALARIRVLRGPEVDEVLGATPREVEGGRCWLDEARLTRVLMRVSRRSCLVRVDALHLEEEIL